MKKIKIPTSRKEREKWGTREIPRLAGENASLRDDASRDAAKERPLRYAHSCRRLHALPRYHRSEPLHPMSESHV